MKRSVVVYIMFISAFFGITYPVFSQTEQPQAAENRITDEDGFYTDVPAGGEDEADTESGGENEETADIQSETVYKTNQPGDQYIILKLSIDIPYRPFKNLQVGGSGTLGYQRFIVKNLTLGGDVSFGYSQTIGKNVFYFVPILFRAGWQFSARKFEIPLSFGIGGAFENYLDRTYFGLALHPKAAVFYRYNRSWSFGMHTGLYILPQWYKDPKNNYTGIIHDIGLAVRYHF